MLIAAACVFAVVLAIDFPLLPAGVSIGDAAEAQTVPYLLGISHPTGFPAYTLAGWLFSHAVPTGSVAWRMNAFTMLWTALSATGVVFLAGAFGCAAVTAGAAGLAFAMGSSIFPDALLANAQAMASALNIYALFGATAFAQNGDRRFLFGASAAAGLGIAVHPTTIWVLPAIAVAMCWQHRAMPWRTIVLAALTAFLPLTLYAYLPIRSAIVSAQHLDPTAAPPLSMTSIDWDTNRPRTLDGFLDEVLGRKEGASGALRGAFDPRNFPIAARFWQTMIARQYSVWIVALAGAGVVALALHARRSLSVVAAGTIGGLLFAAQYRTDAHIDRYVVVELAAAAALAAAAGRLVVPTARAIGLRDAAPILLVLAALISFAHNRVRPALSPYNDGEATIAAVRRDVPDGSVVVAQWNDATALAYGAFIEHALGSRTIVSGWPSEYAAQYPAWMKSRRVVVFASPLALFYDHYVDTVPKRILPSSQHHFLVFEILPAIPVH